MSLRRPDTSFWPIRKGDVSLRPAEDGACRDNAAALVVCGDEPA